MRFQQNLSIKRIDNGNFNDDIIDISKSNSLVPSDNVRVKL